MSSSHASNGRRRPSSGAAPARYCGPRRADNTITAQEVNSAVAGLLRSAEAKVAAEAIRDEIEAMPDPADVVPVIERLTV